MKAKRIETTKKVFVPFAIELEFEKQLEVEEIRLAIVTYFDRCEPGTNGNILMQRIIDVLETSK